jgi:hypothetical protein
MLHSILLLAKPHCLTTRGDSKRLAAARLNRLCVFDHPVSQLRRTVLLDFERQGVIGQEGEPLAIAVLFYIPIRVADATLGPLALTKRGEFNSQNLKKKADQICLIPRFFGAGRRGISD